MRAYRAATEAALAAGYRGLRVAADVTALIRTPEQLDAFARYEHLIDRYMRTAPMARDVRLQPHRPRRRGVDQLACMHPATNADHVLFRLYAADGGGTALAGELDLANQQLLATALTPRRPAAGRRPTGAQGAAAALHRPPLPHRTPRVRARARRRRRPAYAAPGHGAAGGPARPDRSTGGGGLMRTGAAAGHRGYLHEALCYSTDEEFLAVVVPFLTEGARRRGAHLRRLRRADRRAAPVGPVRRERGAADLRTGEQLPAAGGGDQDVPGEPRRAGRPGRHPDPGRR